MTIHLSICESDQHFKNLLTEYIHRALTYELIDTYSNGYELVNKIHYRQNNFLLIDIFTPIMTGLEAIKILRKKNNQTPIITYSQVYQEDIHTLLSEYKQVYYCQKNSNLIFKLTNALLHNNLDFYYQNLHQWKEHLLNEQGIISESKAPAYVLSSIELQIINHACQGLTNKEIGERVFLSGRTIEAYIKKLTEKFKVKNKFQLITYCVEKNLHNYR